jgi:hypothetical protein
MARLCNDGAATFVIFDREPLYDQSEIARIATTHKIEPGRRNALWRVLEQAGRGYLDQKRLVSAARLVRVREDLQLARRLSAQLAVLTPEPGQTAADAVSVSLGRFHLAALREGERRVGGEGGGRLDDMREMLDWLTEVYDAALSACNGPSDPEDVWRRTLTEFYTRELARAWAGGDGAPGERFLADCRSVLDRLDEAGEGAGTAIRGLTAV